MPDVQEPYGEGAPSFDFDQLEVEWISAYEGTTTDTLDTRVLIACTPRDPGVAPFFIPLPLDVAEGLATVIMRCTESARGAR